MPRRTPRYDLLVAECQRLNRIADERADREAEQRRKAERAAYYARLEAELRQWKEQRKSPE